MYSYKISLTFLVLLTLLMFGFIDGGIMKEKSNNNNILVVQDIGELTKNHPELILVPLIKERSNARTETVRYQLGGRVSDDELIAQASDVFKYPAPQNVSFRLTYPSSGTGSIVNYVEINCEQSSVDGNAYVVDGGIGQRKISIAVVAQKTEYFAYNVKFFGTD